MRVTLSLLDMGRAVTVPVPPSLDSITDPFSGASISGESIPSFLSIFNSMGIDVAEFRGNLVQACAS